MLYSLAEWHRRFGTPPRAGFEFEPGDPRRLDHLSLEQQKKRAKELLRAWRTGDSAALQKLPVSPHETDSLKLSDAQRVIAIEHGFHKWSDFKAHIERVQIARDAIAHGRPLALDADRRTLHIRCGWDIAHALYVAGFCGDFLVVRDPLIEGPVRVAPTLEEFVQPRARLLADGDAEKTQEFTEGLLADYTELGRANDYERVMLWFEHDAYDQLLLAKLLDFFSDAAHRPGALGMINVTHFPGVNRFHGLGHLPPEALRALWDDFTPVTDVHLEIGKQAWRAYCAASPEAWAEFVATGAPVLPTLAKAFGRQLRELPSTTTGLGLTQQLALQVLHDHGAMNAARLFGSYANQYEPLPFMGDTTFWRLLSALAGTAQPAITLQKNGDLPKEWDVALTDFGRAVLAGQADWLAVKPARRWVGGVAIDPQAQAHWRVDGQGRVVLVAIS